MRTLHTERNDVRLFCWSGRYLVCAKVPKNVLEDEIVFRRLVTVEDYQ